jgi:hypothetical protein
VSMSNVNPYLNTFGWALTVTEHQGSQWVSEQLSSSDIITLPVDQTVRNIWDPVSRRVVAWSNKQYNGQQGSIAWNIPSPSVAGDINRVDVIVNNNSDNYYIVDTQILKPNQSTGLSLPLGRNYILRIPNIDIPSSQLLNDIESRIKTFEQSHPELNTPRIPGSGLLKSGLNRLSKELFNNSLPITEKERLSDPNDSRIIQRFQIFPVPDQMIIIDKSNKITGSSSIKSNIHTISRTIHNCYKTAMYVKQRPCPWSTSQNMGLILPNRSLTIEFYRDYQIYLQSVENGTGNLNPQSKFPISGIYDTRCKRTAPPIFFKIDGNLSHESCTGISIPTDTGCSFPTPNPPPPKDCPANSWWSKWWWVVLIVVFIIALILIFAVYSSKPKGMVEIQGDSRVPEVY